MKCNYCSEKIISLDNASQHSCFIRKDIDMLDYPKKKIKLCMYNNVFFIFHMSMDQVRWKINALIKKYKECTDNNSKSGRSLMTFEWFDQLERFYDNKKCCCKTYCVIKIYTHQFHVKIYLTSKSSTSLANLSSILNTKNNRKRSLHGSGSNLASKKVALENQWLAYLKTKDERDKINDEKHVDILE
ncbi:hypothetical protein P5V15_014111 [Pogonomyrmex californicus]